MRGAGFRIKLAVGSAALTAGLLILCGSVAWKVNSQIQMARLDREVRSLGTANLDRVFGRDHWERFENALRFIGDDGAQRYLLLVRDEGGREVYRSPDWPGDLEPDRFPAPGPIDVSTEAELDPVHRLHRAPPRPGEPLSRDNPPLPRLHPVFLTSPGGGQTWRIGVMGNPFATLVIAANLNGLESGMRDLRRSFLFGLPLVLLLVAVASWLLAGRALRPVQLLTSAVESIDARGLHERVAMSGYDHEFQRLVEVFNAMLSRLETSFQQANRFTADAAHELRTPLTVLQGELEQALQKAPPDSGADRVLEVVLLEEVEHLKAIVEKLLMLSQADAGHLPVDPQPIDFSALVEEVADDAGILAGGRLTIERSVAPGVTVPVDEILAHQLLQNLATNAIRYNRPGGSVRFGLETRDRQAVLTVANTGPGIPLGERERVFERFYRVDPARTRTRGEGAGLGLSLSREIARAHGGELRLGPDDGEWTVFELTLPLPRNGAGATVHGLGGAACSKSLRQ
jgi:signal transduction histidine kinase